MYEHPSCIHTLPGRDVNKPQWIDLEMRLKNKHGANSTMSGTPSEQSYKHPKIIQYNSYSMTRGRRLTQADLVCRSARK